MGARFLIWFSVFTLLGCVMVAAINILIDPTSYLTNSGLISSTVCAPGLRTDQRQSEPLAMKAFAPDALLIGTSQVGLGFDTSEPLVRQNLGRTYNFGIPGLTTTEMNWLLHKNISALHLRRVVIGTTLGLMIVTDTVPSSGSAEAGSANFSPFWTLKSTVFSLTALSESVYALLSPQRCARPRNRLDGTMLYMGGNIPVQARERLAEVSALFDYSNKEELRRNYRRNFSELSKIARFLCGQSIDVDLVLLPNHAKRMEIWSDMVGDARMDQWKRDVTELVTRLRSKGCAIRGWDFSYHNAITTADFDGPGANSLSFPYWEDIHFRPVVGHRVLQRILLGTGDDFGVELTPETVERHIARAAQAREAWRRSHPAIVASLAALVRNASR